MRKLTILIVAILFTHLAFSQTGVGIKAGYTNTGLSNLEESDNFTPKRGSGLLVGVFGQFGLNDNLSVVAELNFQQKGQKSIGSFEFFGISSEFENSSTINYLEIPILLRFSTGENLTFFGNVGPYLGYAIGGKAKGESTIAGETTTSESKLKFGEEPENYTGDDIYFSDDFNRLELGVYVGAGIQKNLGSGSLILDARFGIGLTDTNNTDEIHPNGVPDDYEPNKFNNITVSIGYAITLGDK